jgi:hypothetical protein
MMTLNRSIPAPSSSLKRDFSGSAGVGAGREYGRAYLKLSRTTSLPSPCLSSGSRVSEVIRDA